MSKSMALDAQGNQVFWLVVSECGPKADVVNFELRRESTLLTSPGISFENSPAKCLVGIWFELHSWTSLPDRAHAHSRRARSNSFLSSKGRS
jgi:hypothetical protein